MNEDIFLEGLKKEEQELLQQLSFVRNLIQKHTSKSIKEGSVLVSPSITHVIIDFPSSMAERVSYVLRTANRFLHVREIAEIIYQNDKSIDEDALVKTLSPLLSRLKREDKLINKKIDSSNQSMVWGVKKWLNQDGSIKEEHKYNESVLNNYRVKFEI